MKIPRALTVAGSDSGGGAGIQADLKTFAVLGVHGMSAITSVTAQNTYEVRRIVDLEPDMIAEQIRACIDDIGVDAVKTGMLHTTPIIERVAAELSRIDAPLVVDPVMVAKSGAPLLVEEAVEALKRRLLPLAMVVTPNAREAEALSGVRIVDRVSQREAARLIAEMGAGAVVVKGGHLPGSESVDVLYHDGAYREYASPRLDGRNTHGTGCVFASAIAAELAKGTGLEEAVGVAKRIVYEAIRDGLDLGRGAGPVNPVWGTLRQARLMSALRSVREAVRTLEGLEGAGDLSPESMINVAEAIPGAGGRDEVVGVPGRLCRVGRRLKAVEHPWPGGSRHVADAVLTLHSLDASIRAAMNLKLSEEVLEACRRAGFAVSSYDRSLEPEDVKRVEGMTIRWGVRAAYHSAGRVTDVIYHRGDVGKEPMALLTGKDAVEVVAKFRELLRHYKGDG